MNKVFYYIIILITALFGCNFAQTNYLKPQFKMRGFNTNLPIDLQPIITPQGFDIVSPLIQPPSHSLASNNTKQSSKILYADLMNANAISSTPSASIDHRLQPNRKPSLSTIVENPDINSSTASVSPVQTENSQSSRHHTPSAPSTIAQQPSSRTLPIDHTASQQSSPDSLSSIKNDTDTSSVSAYQQARSLYQQGLYTDAIRGYQDIMHSSGNEAVRAQALIGLGDSTHALKEYKQAIGYYGQVTALFPGTPEAAEAKYKTGMIYRDQNNTVQARKLFAETYTTYMNTDYATAKYAAQAAIQLGLLARKQHNYAEALVKFNSVVKKWDGSNEAAEALFRRGDLLENESAVRNFEKAYNAYQSIVDTYPTSTWYGIAYERKTYLAENFLHYR